MSKASIDKFLEGGPEEQKYHLYLYITGVNPQSVLAVSNVKHICKKYLRGRYKLKIIDIYQQPELAGTEQIIAAPTLVKKLPAPMKKLIGDMSDTDKVLRGLDLYPGDLV